ncbi:MAG TPA: PAS domain S-box protein, partial [Acidimicrobiales bacterium]|nr:PAS domain S-box protein [Acidimicrobiales bacterium]
MTSWPAVITTDAAGQVTSWNAEAEQLYGWAAEDVLGRHISEIAVGPENAEIAASIMERLAAGEAWQGEFAVQRKDGTRVPAFVRDVPLLDLEGNVLGVIGLSFSLEDPAALPSEVAAPAAASAQADAVIDTLLWNAPVGLALLDVDGRFVRVNARLADMTGLPVSEHLGRTALELFPALPHDEILRDFRTVIDTGTAVVDRDLRAVIDAGAGRAHDWIVSYYPARVSGGPLFGVGIVVVDNTERRAEQAALAASESRLRMSLEAARLTAWDWSPESDDLVWDDAHEAFLGHRLPGGRSRFAEFVDQVHPDDRAGLLDAVAQAVASGSEYEHRYRIVGTDGVVRRVLARGQTVEFPGGLHMVGVLVDVTEAVTAAEQVVRTLESMTDAFFAVDREWRFTYVNRQAERLLGRRAAELVGGRLWDEFRVEADSPFWREYHRAVDEGCSVEFAAEFDPLGWFEVRAHPSDNGLSVYLHDITDRHRAEAATEQARRRLSFLAEASLVLDASLDYGDTLEQVAHLCVPLLGDTCLVDVLEDDGTRRVAVAAIDPERGAMLRALRRRWPPAPAQDVPADQVRATGETAVFERFGDEMWEGLAQDEEHLAALRGLGLRSGVTVPLVARGHVFGAISVGIVTDRGITPDDVVTLEELGRRAGIAVDNARQYSGRVDITRTLQSRLLPASLPDVPGLDIAARYVAAGDL